MRNWKLMTASTNGQTQKGNNDEGELEQDRTYRTARLRTARLRDAMIESIFKPPVKEEEREGEEVE